MSKALSRRGKPLSAWFMRRGSPVSYTHLQGFTFTAALTTKPEVTIENYKGIEAVKKSAEVTDEDIDAEDVYKRQDGCPENARSRFYQRESSPVRNR